MANEVNFLTRIQSKHDTLANWLKVEATFKPLDGEIIVYEVPSNDTSITNAPATLIKVGDGVNYLKDLKYLAARSADVASFLKTDSTGATWTQAKFETWIKSLVTIDDVDTSAFAKNADLQKAISDLANEVDRAKEAEAKALTDAKDYADDLDEAMDARMKVVEGKAHAHANKAELDLIASGDKAKWDAMEQNAKDYADDLDEAMDGRVVAVENKVANWDAAEQNAKGYADGLNTAMGERVDDAEDRIEANEAAIEVLNGGASTEGSVDYKIAQAVAQLVENPDDTMNSINELVTWVNDHADDALALSNQVTENKNAIATEKQRAEGIEGGLNSRLTVVEGKLGDGGSVADDIAGALDEAKGYTDAEVKELADGAVAENAAGILALQGLVGGIAVTTRIENAINELKAGDLQDMQTELNNHGGDIADLAAKSHEHANHSVLNGIKDTDVTAWNAKVDAVTAAAGTGLKATRTGNNIALDFDTTVVFILNGGTSTVNI